MIKIPIKIIIIELTKIPISAVPMKIIRPTALRNVSTVDPSRDLLLKNLPKT